MAFCLNYLKILTFSGFILLMIFLIMILFDVETLKIKSKNKDKAMLITGITSGVY